MFKKNFLMDVFKKKEKSSNDKTDEGTSITPTLTSHFEVAYGDEDPKRMKKMRKEIKKQEKCDLLNHQNIFSLLDKNATRNTRKQETISKKPFINPKDDMPRDDLSVNMGKGLFVIKDAFGVRPSDAETGEDVRPRNFTTNAEYAHFLYTSDFFSSYTPQEREELTRRYKYIHKSK